MNSVNNLSIKTDYEIVCSQLVVEAVWFDNFDVAVSNYHIRFGKFVRLS